MTVIFNPQREGYSSQFVCLSVCQNLISKTMAVSRLKRGLGDDLSPLNVALFLNGPISREKLGNFANSTSTT